MISMFAHLENGDRNMSITRLMILENIVEKSHHFLLIEISSRICVVVSEYPVKVLPGQVLSALKGEVGCQGGRICIELCFNFVSSIQIVRDRP